MPIQQMLLGGGGVPPEPPGQVVFTSTGSNSWTVPNGVTSVSVVCIGAGSDNASNHGGGGGALAYGNNISVTPGASISLQVGLAGQQGSGNTSGSSWFVDLNTLRAGGAYGQNGGASSCSERNCG